MSGSNKYWSKNYWRLLNDLLKQKAFSGRLKEIFEKDKMTWQDELRQMLRELKLPSGLLRPLTLYLMHISLTGDDVEPGIRVLNPKDKTLNGSGFSYAMWEHERHEEIYLLVDPSVNKTEMRSFIEHHWDDLVEKQLKKIRGAKRRSIRVIDRLETVERWKNLIDDGIPPREIAVTDEAAILMGATPTKISKSVSRYRKSSP